MTEDLAEVEQLAGTILRALAPSERRALLRAMAKALVQSQRQRIAAQRNPDGSAYAPRKPLKPDDIGKFAICFLYPTGGSGTPRRVVMKSYRWEAGGNLTGFDIERNAQRSFDRDKVIAFLPVPPEFQNKGGGKLRRSRGGLKRKAMFRRLATARYLRSGVDDQGLWVGFSGKVAGLANVHQYGLRDRPSLRAKPVDYPARELLGATVQDRETLLDLLYEHLEQAS